MRLAWFSPLPPVRSGIATDNAGLLAVLDGEFAIDRFVDGLGRTPPGARMYDAYDFVWKQRREPYDLVVYQLGNSPAHDYIWAYLAPYPGLVVLHDPALHHARARQLLSSGRADDYRREFQYDQPDARREFAEYVVAGLGGSVLYLYSMLRVPIQTSRLVAVHNPRVAADLRDRFPDAAIETIHLGKPPLETGPVPRAGVRATLGVPDGCVVFAAFGKITGAKRVGPILRAFSSLVRGGADARLLLAGDASDYPSLAADVAATAAADRIHVTGYIDDDAVGGLLAAADVCLCLRWPTARETSGSWLQCLAARRPTVISDLAHLVDIPPSVAVRVDLLDEDRSLLDAMQRLAADAGLRAELGRAGHAYWAANHTMDVMANDYRRIVAQAAARPAPAVADLPAHFLDDYSASARRIAGSLGVQIDVLRAARDPSSSAPG